MKKVILLLTFSIAYLLQSCSSNGPKTGSDRSIKPDSVKSISVAEKNKHDTNITGNHDSIVCQEAYDSSQIGDTVRAGSDPIITKTCKFRNYETVSIGTPDYEGRYSWECKLYELQNGKYVKINNSEMFNQDIKQLLPVIYKKFQREYDDIIKDPDSKSCLDGVNAITTYSINDMRIEFEDEKITLIISYDLGSYCMAVSEIYAEFATQEIQKYIK